ncbi:MAG: hypothetical protein ACFFD2_17235 [Promethearchaeota archaeon]
MTNDEKGFYNSLVKRLKEAEKYMDNNDIAIEDREKWMPQLQELMRDMGRIAKDFKLTEEEMLDGIRIE